MDLVLICFELADDLYLSLKRIVFYIVVSKYRTKLAILQAKIPRNVSIMTICNGRLGKNA
jgi:hypothetical protein